MIQTTNTLTGLPSTTGNPGVNSTAPSGIPAMMPEIAPGDVVMEQHPLSHTHN